MGRAIFVVFVQGHVPHALYRIWSATAHECHGPVDDYGLDGVR